MSVVTCICSDYPLQEYPEHYASIAEELQQLELPVGISFISASITTYDAGIWEDIIPHEDNNFVIFSVNVKDLAIITKKIYCVIVQWDFNAECAESLIRYMKSQIQNTSEIELWHFWDDGDYNHRRKTIEIPISQITSAKLEQIESFPVWKEPLVNLCYKISPS